ncbi:MAG: hypothetical protein Q4A33_00825 [Candidatus Saccharibacteria bacterium]|nr:hypothetical protein [Candidatus Saccharibacteria bacterium]
MKNIVVFDSGFGGELFADYVEKEVPILETVRVIDWQQSQQNYQNPKTARARTLEKLRPYINHSEAIIITNQLVSTTSLEYFRKKYPSQKFSGFSFGQVPKTNAKHALILTTKAMRKTLAYHKFVYHLKLRSQEFDCDKWIDLINAGEYMEETVARDLAQFKKWKPGVIILGDSHLADVKPILRDFYGPTVAIVDGYKNALKNLCHELGIRGGTGKK